VVLHSVAMDRFLIRYRPILWHHAPGEWLGGWPAAFARFDEKVSHGGSQ
jgi:hypothetical protein